MHDQTDGPDDGQVSETNNLRESDVGKSFQQAEGVPPGDDTAQEDQSVGEAEISPEHGGVEDSVEHSRGEETE